MFIDFLWAYYVFTRSFKMRRFNKRILNDTNFPVTKNYYKLSNHKDSQVEEKEDEDEFVLAEGVVNLEEIYLDISLTEEMSVINDLLEEQRRY